MRAGLLVGLVVVLAPRGAWAGEIQGLVRLERAVPSREDLPVTKDKVACGEHVVDESLLVAAGRLANVVVTVEGAKASPALHLTLDQKNCRFVPHVLVAPKGSTLEIVNSDPVLHNIHGWMGIRTRFNVPMPEPHERVPVVLDRSGTVEVRCDVHAWMSAYVAVVEGPAAVSGLDGTFAIDEIPAGTYTLRAWHERLGERTLEVTIPAKGAAHVEITYGEGVTPGR
ncbi:MAG TPA: hypothetical protein VLV17_05080 [Anaeromyxobacteraceae bacterium]|nr:hypothetical protein [Anaeromyxobacteraceae bacterium]